MGQTGFALHLLAGLEISPLSSYYSIFLVHSSVFVANRVMNHKYSSCELCLNNHYALYGSPNCPYYISKYNRNK